MEKNSKKSKRHRTALTSSQVPYTETGAAKLVCVAPETEESTGPSSEEELENPFASFPEELGSGEAKQGPQLLSQLRGQFGVAQLEDPNLIQARSNVQEIESKLAPGVSKLTYPHFLIKNQLLYYVQMVNGQKRCLLVVPKPYVSTVLHLAHSHVLGAHLGVEKTKDRIMVRFFWPGVVRAVTDYCQTCPECQKKAPKPHFKNPLIPLPIIDVPFDRIAMDLVGPLVKSARGHQYILVVMD